MINMPGQEEVPGTGAWAVITPGLLMGEEPQAPFPEDGLSITAAPPAPGRGEAAQRGAARAPKCPVSISESHGHSGRARV